MIVVRRFPPNLPELDENEEIWEGLQREIEEPKRRRNAALLAKRDCICDVAGEG